MFPTILLLLFSLGQLGRVSLVNGEVNFYLYELLITAFVIKSVFERGTHPLRVFFEKNKWPLLFIITLALSFLITLNRFNLAQNIIAGLYLLRVSVYFLFFVYLSNYLKSFSKQKYQRALFIFSWVLVLFSAAQYFLYPNLRNLYYLGWDPHQYRVFGTFLEPSIIAATFGLIFIYFYFHRSKQKGESSLRYILAILGLLTYSRGFYLAALFSTVFYLVKAKLIKQLAALLIAFVVALSILPRPFGEGVNLLRTVSIKSRLVDYTKAIQIWKANPIFGVGYNHLPFVKNAPTNRAIPDHADSAFHSSFLTILTTSGAVGLVAFILVLVSFAGISQSAFFYTIFLSLFTITDNIFLHPLVLFIYLFLLAGELSIFRRLR